MKKLLSVVLLSVICLGARATEIREGYGGTTMEILPANSKKWMTFCTGYKDVRFCADEFSSGKGEIDIEVFYDRPQDYDKIQSNMTALLDSKLNLTVDMENVSQNETIDSSGIRHNERDKEYHVILDFIPAEIDQIYIYGVASPRK